MDAYRPYKVGEFLRVIGNGGDNPAGLHGYEPGAIATYLKANDDGTLAVYAWIEAIGAPVQQDVMPQDVERLTVIPYERRG